MIELYWITRLIYMHDVFGNLFAFACFITAFSTVVFVVAELNNEKHFIIRAFWGIFLFLWIFSGLVNVFTPTKEEAAFIVAGGAVVAAAQSDAGQRIASKSVAVLEGSLDTILGKEAVAKAQLDVEKRVVDAVKNQMGIKDESKGSEKASGNGK
jgi:hypothetical protein